MTMTPSTVPFNRPAFVGAESTYLEEAIAGWRHSGDGPFTRRCHELLQTSLGVPKVLLTTSCTHALEMTSILSDIGQGDEVIVPAFTFVSSVNAFVLRGAKPVFCDVRPDTLNLDERRLEALITPRTRAIVVVHYAGVGCEMDEICRIARAAGVTVIEDNAHGLFGSYKGKPLGTFGALSTQSFHETKNFSCGEGGALLINDPRYVERAEIVWEKGTDRRRFFRGQVDKYSWVDIGSSYLPSELLAAILYGQLEQRSWIQATRRGIWERYQQELGDWAGRNGVLQPQIPEHCDQSYHMYYLLLPDLVNRQRFIAHLRDRGIVSVFHYLPLNLSKMGRSFGGHDGQCPVTESMSDKLVRLPFYNTLSGDDQSRVIESIRQFEVRA
jgi:dTDP-4-amino-4,6-dideoxygalactose transaminase